MSAGDLQSRGLHESFPLKGGSAPTATHYCSGCGHGVLHKLIGEAMADLEIQDRTVFLSPVGCSVFGYYYFDCGHVQCAHGRAPAVGAAISRVARDAVVISYQGDGDLASIGFNETLHAANRGEKMAVFFVNNGIYGMTGGQMAPTTLIGQKTVSSPYGRNAVCEGHPLHVCEIVDQLPAPVYIERCSLADAGRVMKARQAIRKALALQKEGKGFAFVEFLSPCSTNIGKDSARADRFVIEQMESEFPLGNWRDRSREATPVPWVEPVFDRDRLDRSFAEFGEGGQPPLDWPDYRTRSVKVGGFGGQGILSLGLMIANVGKIARRHVTWFPSYGPEQRGGTANCTSIIAGRTIGSPTVSEPDVLIAMNAPTVKRFAQSVRPDGLVIYDAEGVDDQLPNSTRNIRAPSLWLADREGNEKAANTAMLGVLAATGAMDLPQAAWSRAIDESFAARPALVELNRRVFHAAFAWAKEQGIA